MKVNRFVSEYASWKKKKIEAAYYYITDGKFDDVKRNRIDTVERSVKALERGLIPVDECMKEIAEA